jgi:single-strand DNA-binding protein
MDNTITICGNVVRPPEMKFGTNGTAIMRLSVAVSRKTKNGDENTSFFDVTAFNGLAENIQTSCNKGTRVVVTGRLEQSTWETEKGEKRSRVEIVADDVAVSLRWAPVEQANSNRDWSFAKKQKAEYDDAPF